MSEAPMDPDRMSAVLKTLIDRYGQSLISDPTRLERLLKDFMVNVPNKERLGLVAVAKIDLIERIAAAPSKAVDALQFERWAVQIHEETGMDTALLRQSIRVWATVFDRTVEDKDRVSDRTVEGNDSVFDRIPCAACGEDEFGRWIELCINGATQRLRWIEPGEFQMGSPEDEVGRRMKEHSFSNAMGCGVREGPRHTVKLSRGFWLADTACTQAFWLAVVGGKNPSRFQDDPSLPVEGVSWDDINTLFLPKLRDMVNVGWSSYSEVVVKLPSEAQWEYACRAGTTTRFSFGETITPELVNYNGLDGKSATIPNRQRTVPVASLPANQWGFYEMHGNVWEWCRDRARVYVSETVLDPKAKAEGPEYRFTVHAVFRVLRGGSWKDDAPSARAANRTEWYCGSRNDNFGFRFGLWLNDFEDFYEDLEAVLYHDEIKEIEKTEEVFLSSNIGFFVEKIDRRFEKLSTLAKPFASFLFCILWLIFPSVRESRARYARRTRIIEIWKRL